MIAQRLLAACAPRPPEALALGLCHVRPPWGVRPGLGIDVCRVGSGRAGCKSLAPVGGPLRPPRSRAAHMWQARLAAHRSRGLELCIPGQAGNLRPHTQGRGRRGRRRRPCAVARSIWEHANAQYKSHYRPRRPAKFLKVR